MPAERLTAVKQEVRDQLMVEQLLAARQYLYELLVGPWNGTGDLARMRACAFFNHPAPSAGVERCVCGWRKR